MVVCCCHLVFFRLRAQDGTDRDSHLEEEVRELMGHNDFEAWENGLQAPLLVVELSVC